MEDRFSALASMHSPAFALNIYCHSGPVLSPSTASGVYVSLHHPIPIYGFLSSITIIIGFGNPTTSIRIPRIHPGMDETTHLIRNARPIYPLHFTGRTLML